MLAGSIVVTWVTDPFTTWTTLILLLSIHLGMNYKAVRAVNMRTLNRQRATIVFSQLSFSNRLLTPAEVSGRERIFENNGIVRDVDNNILGHCSIGVSFTELLGILGGQESSSGSRMTNDQTLTGLWKVYHDASYVLWLDQKSRRVLILLKKGSNAVQALQAWFAACCTLEMLSKAKTGPKKGHKQEEMKHSRQDILAMLKDVEASVSQRFPKVIERLSNAGFDIDVAALETRSGTRINITDR